MAAVGRTWVLNVEAAAAMECDLPAGPVLRVPPVRSVPTIPGTSQEEAVSATRKLEDEQLWLAHSSKVRLSTLEMAEFWLQKKEWRMAVGKKWATDDEAAEAMGYTLPTSPEPPANVMR